MKTFCVFINICFFLIFFKGNIQAQNIDKSSMPFQDNNGEIFLDLDTGGHKAIIRKLMFSKNRKFLISTSDDKTIRIWGSKTGSVVKTIRYQKGMGRYGKFLTADISPNGRLLAVAGTLGNNGGYIAILDYISEEVLMVLKGHEYLIDIVAFSPDGNYLVSGSADKTARIWDLKSGKTVFVLSGHQDKVRAAAFSLNGEKVATGSSDTTIKLWDVKTGLLLKTLKGHKHHVRSLVFSQKSGHIFSVSGDKTIKIWDGNSGNFIKNFAKLSSAGAGLSFGQNGKILVVGHQGKGDSICYAFDSSTGKVLSAFDKHGDLFNVLAITISTDGKTVASGGGEDHEIFLWDPKSGKDFLKMQGLGSPIWQVAINKNGDVIAFGRQYKKTGSLLNKSPLDQQINIKKSLVGKLEIGLDKKLSKPISIGGLSNFIGAIQSANNYRFEDKKGKTLKVYKNNKIHTKITKSGSQGYYHMAATFTVDGKYIFSGGHNGYLIKYNTDTGKIFRSLHGHTDSITSLVVSSDNKYLLSSSRDQTIKLWDVNSDRLIWTIFVGTDNEWIIWTPSGYYMSSNFGDKYIGWHLNNGENTIADFYSAFQFERILYRPDYVNAYLQYGGDREKVESKLGGDFFNINNLRDIAPPKISIISPSYGKHFSHELHIPLKLSVESNSIDMLNYSVFVNNIPVTPSAERNLKGPDKRSFIKEINIPLFDKKNQIRVEVFNGKSMGLAETVVYKEGAVAKKDKGDLYLLSVGANEFSKMPAINLSFAADDAKGLEEYYHKQGGKFFEHVFTKSISDLSKTKPSKENIIKSFEFIKNATAEDTVVVFLASHGLSDPAGNYYFIPRDASTSDVAKLIKGSVRGASGSIGNLSSLISWKVFFDALRSVPGKRLLVVDTCQAKNISGTFDIHSLAKRSATSSFALLAASKGDEVSQEYPNGNHGLFTFALLKGLSGDGDNNRDGQIALYELYEFVSKFVGNNKDRKIGNQTPQLIAPKELKEMILAAH